MQSGWMPSRLVTQGFDIEGAHPRASVGVLGNPPAGLSLVKTGSDGQIGTTNTLEQHFLTSFLET
jgi:hypothetical protein